MKDLIYKKINHVLIVLGAKKMEVLGTIYSNEEAWHFIMRTDELNEYLQDLVEGYPRLYEYMLLEVDVDTWIKSRHEQLNSGAFELEEIRNVVHKDMLDFMKKIEKI
ncbi:MAG: hypothetical protein RIS20_2273 [Bacteroidota bacterium]|jgi:hypothetical protein